MTQKLYIFLFFISMLGLSASTKAMEEPAWTHVELGAANYGDTLGDRVRDREAQYQILCGTVKSLIETKGQDGVIYINDINPKAAQVCVTHLKEYLARAFPEASVKIIEVVGDYFKIAFPQCSSMHLKNPEGSVLRKLFSGAHNDRIVELCRLSQTGLTIQTMFHDFPCVHDFQDDRLKRDDVEYKCEFYIWPTDGKACKAGTYKRFVLSAISKQ